MPPPRSYHKTPPSLRLLLILVSLSLAALWLLGGPATPRASAQTTPPFKNFEGPQVHPLALTPDGTRLLAVNSPNGTLSVFQLAGGTPVRTAEIPVGLEPVSVAARNNREAWVVNWLSDSVSVVDLASGNVTRTIDVGDEPTDVLFAGTSRELAFVCVSGLSKVKIFDPNSATGAPQTIDIFGKQPRALARTGNGAQVFVSVFESGNQTTVVPESSVASHGGLPPPSPAMAPGLPAAPVTSLIVKWDGTNWVDEINRIWGNPGTTDAALIKYRLADIDLVVIDAAAQTPAISSQVRGLATHVGNMAFDPTTSRLFVANLESTNQVRFEPNLAGRFQHSRVSILNAVAGSSPTVSSVNDLNPHVNLAGPGDDAERSQSLAMPSDIVHASDGTTYVAATSSARVGVLAATGVVTGRIAVGQGPTGLALDEARQRLYVLNRFDGTVGVVDTNSKTQVSQVSLGFNPEPANVKAGRQFLYDASLSAHGTVSCASCHLNAHRDGLAWDLGDPRGQMDSGSVLGVPVPFHPMKGPMTTQSLRDIIGNAPLHWRGDRSALAAFNPAFVSLLGGARQLSTAEMAAFEAFVRSLAYPPNPNESLFRASAEQSGGFGFFSFEKLDGGTLNCSDCHIVRNFGSGTNNVLVPKEALQESQGFKVPQLRGLYQKTGLTRDSTAEQITGFGFIHDGSVDTLFNFMKLSVFKFNVDQATADSWRTAMADMIMRLDTGTAPAVGLQVTVNADNKTSFSVNDRINLLTSQCGPTSQNCDLIVRGIYGGSPRGFLHVGGGVFQPDSGSEANVTRQQLLDAAVSGAELTFTGVPPGTGRRRALDTNGDGTLDNDAPPTSVRISGRVVDAQGNGISGVTVTLNGSQNALTTTDASGKYSFGFVSTTGTHTVTPARSGFSFAPANRTFANPAWNQTASFIAPSVANPTPNASDASSFFVTQHYSDFLNREPDAPGLAFWTNQIESCGADQVCREVRRINVSAAFYLSIEFQQTGFLVYRTNKASFGNLPGKPVPVTLPQLMPDAQRISRNVIVNVGAWEAQLETNKVAFFQGWVQRPAFLAQYPSGMPPAQFVDTLIANAGICFSSLR
ncbi:MAG: carboxypeptidase regulatory-like domain-containing protein [Acidobacteria bacterium]|nr:carboxypeptidase regulatory-like domain-containing protein [Acidobacteriota bacterium]